MWREETSHGALPDLWTAEAVCTSVAGGMFTVEEGHSREQWVTAFSVFGKKTDKPRTYDWHFEGLYTVIHLLLLDPCHVSIIMFCCAFILMGKCSISCGPISATTDGWFRSSAQLSSP